MARITILGGTGYAGGAIVAEAAKRGHEVTAVSRSKPENPIEGVEYVTGSVLDPAVLDAATTDRDVVISALSPRGDMAGKVEAVLQDLANRLETTPSRLAHVGGASSLQVEPDGPTLWDLSKDHIPAEVKPEVETGIAILRDFRESPEALDWFYVSPPEKFGSWESAPVTGSYQLGGDVLLRDAAGESKISAADLAVAIVDEIEQPKHRRQRFTAAH
jgi:putative NADH-flavin reductase